MPTYRPRGIDVAVVVAFASAAAGVAVGPGAVGAVGLVAAAVGPVAEPAEPVVAGPAVELVAAEPVVAVGPAADTGTKSKALSLVSAHQGRQYRNEGGHRDHIRIDRRRREA